MLQEVFTAGKYQGLFVTDYQQGIYQISLRLPCRIWSRCEVSASNFNADASSTAGLAACMIGQICPPKNSLLASHGSDSFARAGAAAVVLRPLPSQAAYRVISSPG